MSNANPFRNSVLRSIAGGSSRELRNLRALRRMLRVAGKPEKFAAMIRAEIPHDDKPENHIHPRHLRTA